MDIPFILLEDNSEENRRIEYGSCMYDTIREKFTDKFKFSVCIEEYDLLVYEVNELMELSIQDNINYLQSFIKITNMDCKEYEFEVIDTIVRDKGRKYNDLLKHFCLDFCRPDIELDGLYTVLNFLFKRIRFIEKSDRNIVDKLKTDWKSDLPIMNLLDISDLELNTLLKDSIFLKYAWTPKQLIKAEEIKNQVSNCIIRKHKGENDYTINEDSISEILQNIHKELQITCFRYRKRRDVLDSFDKLRQDIMSDLNYLRTENEGL